MTKFLSVSVNCPYKFGSKRDIELIYIDNELPESIGCNEFSGMKECAKCIKSLKNQFPVYPGIDKWPETVTPDV